MRRHQPKKVSTASFHGWDGLDASNYYSATGIVGAQTGFHVQFWAWFESTAASANRPVIATVTGNPANRGWRFESATTNATFNFGCYDSSSSTTKSSPNWTVETGRAVHVLGCIRSNFVRLFIDGVQVGSGTAITTFAGPTTQTMTIGRRLQDTNSAGGLIRVLGGIAGGHYAPSDAEILAAYQAGLAAKSISHIVGGTAQQAWVIPDAGATIAPTVGAESLTRSGTPTYV